MGASPERAPVFWQDRPGWSALRDRQWKAHLQNGAFRLYDVRTDPSESKDVAGKYPELAERYHAMLKKWETSLPGKRD
jgi:arylsulfatase A-like enzyme